MIVFVFRAYIASFFFFVPWAYSWFFLFCLFEYGAYLSLNYPQEPGSKLPEKIDPWTIVPVNEPTRNVYMDPKYTCKFSSFFILLRLMGPKNDLEPNL